MLFVDGLAPHIQHLNQEDHPADAVWCALQRIGDAPTADDLIDFAYNSFDGNLRPIQIESELRRFLEVVQYQPPRTILETGTANGGTLMLLTRAAAPNAIIISIDLPDGRLSYADARSDIYESFALPAGVQVPGRVREHGRRLRTWPGVNPTNRPADLPDSSVCSNAVH